MHNLFVWQVYYLNMNTYILGSLLLMKFTSNPPHLPGLSCRTSSSTSQTKPSRPHVINGALFIWCISLFLTSHGVSGVKLISELLWALADPSESYPDWCLLRLVNRCHFYPGIVSCHNTIRSMVWSSQFII